MTWRPGVVTFMVTGKSRVLRESSEETLGPRAAVAAKGEFKPRPAVVTTPTIRMLG